MRQWHRWLMTVFIVIIAYWIGSGLILAVYDLTDTHQVWGRATEAGGPGVRQTDFAIDAPTVTDPQVWAAGIAAAQKSMGGSAIASVDLRMAGTVPRLQFAQASGARASMRRFYADTALPMSERVADGDPDANVPNYVTGRHRLKAWHRGNAAGLAGQLIGLFAGLGLAGLTITGTLTYFQLWKARRTTGRPGFFWTVRESRWRRTHRWISIVAAAFVLNIAVTGLILAYGELQLNVWRFYGVGVPPYPRPGPLPPVSEGELPADINGMLERTYQAARASDPGGRIVDLQLVKRDAVFKGIAVFGGNSPRVLAFDAATGAPVADWSTGGVQVGTGYLADWHQVVKRLHRGDVIGNFNGRYIDITAGLASLYLVVSAGFLYVDLFQRRRKIGRRGLFWT